MVTAFERAVVIDAGIENNPADITIGFSLRAEFYFGAKDFCEGLLQDVLCRGTIDQDVLNNRAQDKKVPVPNPFQHAKNISQKRMTPTLRGEEGKPAR